MNYCSWKAGRQSFKGVVSFCSGDGENVLWTWGYLTCKIIGKAGWVGVWQEQQLFIQSSLFRLILLEIITLL